MNTQWLDVLSGIDKMVLGSIVGSIVLAFVLLVVIFSVKIKSQQDRIVYLKDEIKAKSDEISALKESVKVLKKDQSDAFKKLDKYKTMEYEFQKTISKLEKDKDNALEEIKKLKKIIEKLKKEKSVAIEDAKKIQAKLEESQKEIEKGHKRNEFWIDQLSQLRTKHDALKHKLKTLEGRKNG